MKVLVAKYYRYFADEEKAVADFYYALSFLNVNYSVHSMK